MLTRQFTEEQVMFREAYRRFLAEEVVPHMERFRDQGVVDRDIFKKRASRAFSWCGRRSAMGAWMITTSAGSRSLLKSLPMRVQRLVWLPA